MKAKVSNAYVEMCVNGEKWMLKKLYLKMIVLITGNEWPPQKKAELNVNVNKSKVMVFERSESAVVDIDHPTQSKSWMPERIRY